MVFSTVRQFVLRHSADNRAGWGAGVVFVALLAGFPSAVVADDDVPRPSSEEQELDQEQQEKFKKLVDQGKVHFAQNNYEKALAEFEKAYDIKQSPNLLFNMGLVAEKSGNLSRALDYYKTFVVSPEVSLDLRDKAQKRIKVLEPIVEDQQEDEQEREAKKEAAEEDEPESLAETDDATDPEEGSGSDGSAEEPPDKREVDDQRGGSAVGGLLLTGGGVAAIGGGVVFTLLGEQAHSRFGTGETPAERRATQQAALRNQWMATGLFAGGLGAATGGIIMLLNRTGGDQSSSTALRPSLGPDFAGVRFRADF